MQYWHLIGSLFKLSIPLSNFIEAVRWSTIALFKGFSEKACLRTGVANGNKASVRALGFHIAGHELHHINVLKERYLL